MTKRKLIRRSFMVYADSWEICQARGINLSELIRDFVDIRAHGEGESDPDSLRYLMDQEKEFRKIRDSEIEIQRSKIRTLESEKHMSMKREERYKEKYNIFARERILAETYTQINNIVNDNLRTKSVDEIYAIIEGYGLIESLDELGVHITIDEFKKHIRKIIDAGIIL